MRQVVKQTFDFGRIGAVFLDADGTVFTLNGSIGEIYSALAAQHGIRVAPAELDRVVPAVWSSQEEKYLNVEDGYRTSTERERLLWYDFVDSVFRTAGVPELPVHVISEIYEYFGLPESRRIQPGVDTFLEEARRRGLGTGLFSNNDDRLFRLVNELQLNHLFDFVFTSGCIGFKKPAREAFGAVAEASGLQPGELLYVGDTLELDYVAARKAGWNALLLAESAPNQGVEAVSSFAELTELLRAA